MLLAALFALTALACGPPAERVILVTLDTLRADHIAVYGHPRAHTPTLDAMAAGGVRFATAISPTPLTLPSHSSLMTGLDPPEHGVRHNGLFRLADEIPTLAEGLTRKGLRSAAFVGAFVLAEQYGLARGFEHYDDRTERPSAQGGIRGFAERSADQVVDAAIGWLDQENPERFFLWIHFYDPHAEYRAPPGFAASFARSPYLGEIAFSDAQLGRLQAYVREHYPVEGTLFVVTSDHGESLGEHGEPTHSHTIYEATQHIPLLMQGAGLPTGRVVEGVVALKDVGPTILELAGGEALPAASGRSLLSAIESGTAEPRSAYVETLSTQFDWEWSPLLGLRTAEYKYIRAPEPELYALDEDPKELRNLFESQPERAAELDAELEALLKQGQPVLPNLDPSEADRARLEALGYVVRDPEAPTASLGVVGGPNPMKQLWIAERVSEADHLVAQGRPEAALEVIDGLAGHEHILVRLLESNAAYRAGDATRAERAARSALATSARYPVAFARLGQALEAQGQREEASAAWEEMVRLSPGLGYPKAALARLALRGGDRPRAEALFRESLAAPSPDGSASFELAGLLIETGRAAEASALLAEADPESLTDAAIALGLAASERKGGLLEAANERLDRLLEASPGLPPALLARAELRDDRGQAEKAGADREAALATLDPALDDGGAPTRRLRIQIQRARALSGLGRTPEARAALEEALGSRAFVPLAERQRVAELAGRLGIAQMGEGGAEGGEGRISERDPGLAEPDSR